MLGFRDTLSAIANNLTAAFVEMIDLLLVGNTMHPRSLP